MRRRRSVEVAALQGAGAAQTFQEFALAAFGANIISYLPLNDVGGSVAEDLTDNDRDGAYSNITLNDATGPDGEPVVFAAGTSNASIYINWYSASLAAAFDGNEGTMILAIKAEDADTWSAGSSRFIYQFLADSSNYHQAYKNGTTGQLRFQSNMGGSGTMTINKDDLTGELGWIVFAFTWSRSNNRRRGYYNGVQVGSDQTAPADFVGALLSDRAVVLGAVAGLSSAPWKGWGSSAILLDREATPGEVQAVADFFLG